MTVAFCPRGKNSDGHRPPRQTKDLAYVFLALWIIPRDNSSTMRLPLVFFLLVLAFAARAAEPFLKPNDVIALVGGEDMVVASEYGYLELLLTRALPDYKLKFRCLAWEGDTV